MKAARMREFGFADTSFHALSTVSRIDRSSCNVLVQVAWPEGIASYLAGLQIFNLDRQYIIS
jgi:hypothetical protein